jgi:hypothetical protein
VTILGAAIYASPIKPRLEASFQQDYRSFGGQFTNADFTGVLIEADVHRLQG